MLKVSFPIELSKDIARDAGCCFVDSLVEAILVQNLSQYGVPVLLGRLVLEAQQDLLQVLSVV